MNTGEKIRQARTKKGFSQEYLGSKIGVKQSVISEMESGNREVNIEELLKISETLEEPLANLLHLPMNVEFNNCPGAGIVVYHQFPPELIKVLEKLADKL